MPSGSEIKTVNREYFDMFSSELSGMFFQISKPWLSCCYNRSFWKQDIGRL